MPSLVAKKKGNKLYYYVVESARVEGKPRIVHQAYLGTAEKLAEMVRDRTAPIPLAASTRLACPPPCGRPLSKLECGTCSLPFGPGHAPDLLPLTTCCWPPYTASASPVLKPKWPSGIALPSCPRCGSFPPSA